MIYICTCLLYIITHIQLYFLRWKAFRTVPLPQQIQDFSERISIIIPSFNQAEDLQELIPQLLEQDYPGGFEIIVVIHGSKDNTMDILQFYESTYRNIRHTSIPKSAHFIDFQKLAINIGIKAARTEWLIIASPKMRPQGSAWLQALTKGITTDCDLIFGYANYTLTNQATHPFQYETHINYVENIACLLQNKSPHSIGLNCAFKKKALNLDKLYPPSSIKYTIGGFSLLINQIAQHGTVKFTTDTDAIVSINTDKETLSEIERARIVEKLFIATSSKTHRLKDIYTFSTLILLYLGSVIGVLPLIPLINSNFQSDIIVSLPLLSTYEISPETLVIISILSFIIYIISLLLPIKWVVRNFKHFNIKLPLFYHLVLPIALPILNIYKRTSVFFKEKSYRRRM